MQSQQVTSRPPPWLSKRMDKEDNFSDDISSLSSRTDTSVPDLTQNDKIFYYKSKLSLNQLRKFYDGSSSQADSTSNIDLENENKNNKNNKFSIVNRFNNYNDSTNENSDKNGKDIKYDILPYNCKHLKAIKSVFDSSSSGSDSYDNNSIDCINININRNNRNNFDTLSDQSSQDIFNKNTAKESVPPNNENENDCYTLHVNDVKSTINEPINIDVDGDGDIDISDIRRRRRGDGSNRVMNIIDRYMSLDDVSKRRRQIESVTSSSLITATSMYSSNHNQAEFDGKSKSTNIDQDDDDVKVAAGPELQYSLLTLRFKNSETQWRFKRFMTFKSSYWLSFWSLCVPIIWFSIYFIASYLYNLISLPPTALMISLSVLGIIVSTTTMCTAFYFLKLMGIEKKFKNSIALDAKRFVMNNLKQFQDSDNFNFQRSNRFFNRNNNKNSISNSKEAKRGGTLRRKTSKTNKRQGELNDLTIDDDDDDDDDDDENISQSRDKNAALMLRASFILGVLTPLNFGFHTLVSSWLNICFVGETFCVFSVPIFSLVATNYAAIVLFVVIPDWLELVLIEFCGKLFVIIPIALGWLNYRNALLNSNGSLSNGILTNVLLKAVFSNEKIVYGTLNWIFISFVLNYSCAFMTTYALYLRSVVSFQHQELLAAYIVSKEKEFFSNNAVWPL